MGSSIKISLALFFVFALSIISLFGQATDSYEYNSEFTWGINKNSSGGLIGGFTFKKARKLNDGMLESFGLEIMNVKHPQEVRRSSQRTGNYFIYGKSNYLYALRFQYGRDFILFKKASQQGVEIKVVTAAGPSFGVVAPYYIQWSKDNYTTTHEQYSPYNPDHSVNMDHSFSNITGTGNIFEGLTESKIQMGANFKTALNFELGTLKSQVTGFEVGFLLDAYINQVELMPTSANKSVFPTIFFTLFYGNRK